MLITKSLRPDPRHLNIIGRQSADEGRIATNKKKDISRPGGGVTTYYFSPAFVSVHIHMHAYSFSGTLRRALTSSCTSSYLRVKSTLLIYIYIYIYFFNRHSSRA